MSISRKVYDMILECLILFLRFIFRERGREGETEGETHHCVVFSHTFHLRPDLQPRHVPSWEATGELLFRRTVPYHPQQSGQDVSFGDVLVYLLK